MKIIFPHSVKVGTGDGGGVTVNVSEAVPLFPEEEVRSPVVLTKVPGVLPVTSTVTVQVLPAPTVPPVYEMTLDPATAISVPPVHVLEALAGLAMTIPAGRLSVKSSAVATSELAVLSMVNVSVLILPGEIVSGAKLLENAGGGSMVRKSVAGSLTVKPA